MGMYALTKDIAEELDDPCLECLNVFSEPNFREIRDSERKVASIEDRQASKITTKRICVAVNMF